MKLSSKAFGLASGIVWGLTMLLATLWVVVKGGGEHLRLLEQFYVGYNVSPLGSLVGLVYGFINGLICGAIFAWIHNKFVQEE